MVKADDLANFYAAVCDLPNPTARDFILLVLFTGMRKTECASLMWDDIDIKAKLIRIPGLRTKSGNKLDLPMSDFVHDLLVKRRALGLGGQFVFPSHSKSGRIVDTAFSLGLVAEKTGVRISNHDLRRTFLTVAESCDVSPLALKALVNHSIGATDVTSGYIIMTVERLRGPAQRVADAMKKLCGIEDLAGENVARIRGAG